MQAASTRDLSGLIGRIYDSVLHPGSWPEVLAGSCAFVGAQAANLFWQDAAAGAATVLHTWNDDPAYTASYHQTYASLNPLFPALTFIEPGVVFSGGDLIPHGEFRQTRFYKEWVQPQGLVDAIGANLQRYATSSACFSLQRGERHGLVDDEARRRLGLLVPHVRRAVLISREIDRQKAKSATLEALLDGVAAGVFLVDAACRLGQVNDAGRAMAEDARVLTVRGGMVAMCDTAADRKLRSAVAAVGDGIPLVGQDVSIALGPDAAGQRWHASILPLAPGTRRSAWPGFNACAAVFVRKVEVPAASAIELTARHHRLTPAEIRVLQAVFTHSRVDDIAAALGLSRGTVKSHLGALFSKTSTTRRADLVKIVLAHGDPLS